MPLPLTHLSSLTRFITTWVGDRFQSLRVRYSAAPCALSCLLRSLIDFSIGFQGKSSLFCVFASVRFCSAQEEEKTDGRRPGLPPPKHQGLICRGRTNAGQTTKQISDYFLLPSQF